MQKNVPLPQVELTMESVLVVRWLVEVGQRVSAQQPILEIESQKGIVEIESPKAGFVRRLCVNENQSISEKALLCILTDTIDEPFTDRAPASSPSPGNPGEGRGEGSSGISAA